MNYYQLIQQSFIMFPVFFLYSEFPSVSCEPICSTGTVNGSIPTAIFMAAKQALREEMTESMHL